MRIRALSLGQDAKTSVKVLSVSWKTRPRAIIGFFCGAILEIVSFIVTIYATAQIGALLARYIVGGDTSRIWWWLVVDIAAAIGVALGYWIMSVNKLLLYYRLVQWSTSAFTETMCSIDVADFYNSKVRNQINKAQNGYTWQIPNFAEATLDLIYGIIRFVVTAVVVAQINWWLIPILGIFLLPSFLAEKRLAKLQWFVWDAKGDERHVFWGLEWIIRQAKHQMELRSTQATSYVKNKLSRMNRDFYANQEREYRRINRFMGPSKVIEVLGTAIGSVILLQQFLTGSVPLEQYFFLSGALLRIGGSLTNIFATLSRMQEHLLFATNFFMLLLRRPTIVDQLGAKKVERDSPPTIQFENVSFCYPGQKTDVLTGLNLTIIPGEHIALVGENGAGKSTIIKLLLRFYTPTQGTIYINGTDLQEISINSWYDQLATLFQDFIQYPFSISENIEIARPKARDRQVRLEEAAALSNADQMISSYRYGWDTVLDNSFRKGTEPSGGQWQRIALARAFYRHANVLILDEPTAAIDARAEYDIFNNIFTHYHAKTTIIVSHRFSTVRRASRIIVLQNGRVIEEGTHEKLMGEPGLYKDMFLKQAEGYQN